MSRQQRDGGRGWSSIEKFSHHAERCLAELRASLADGSYRPHPVKRVEIPKGDGKTRPLGIPVVKDRIVQTALKMAIEPIFEVQFRPGSYGFRPGRGCKDALREVDRLLKEGFTHVVDADLKSYFDTIPHKRLLSLVEGSISDGRVLALIEAFLHQEIMSQAAHWHPTAGTPQGAVLSPLLANLYLHPLDVLMEQGGWRMVRYADDFVILCATAAEAREALAQVTAWVEANGLTLHPDKTRSATAANRARGSTSWVTGSRPVADTSRQELAGVEGQGAREDGPQPGRQPRADHCRSQSDAARLVWVFQTCQASLVPKT